MKEEQRLGKGSRAWTMARTHEEHDVFGKLQVVQNCECGGQEAGGRHGGPYMATRRLEPQPVSQSCFRHWCLLKCEQILFAT